MEACASLIPQYCTRNVDAFISNSDGGGGQSNESTVTWTCNFPSDVLDEIDLSLQQASPGSSDHQDAEPFPILFAMVLFAISVTFTFVVFGYDRMKSMSKPNSASRQNGDEDESELAQTRNSWVETDLLDAAAVPAGAGTDATLSKHGHATSHHDTEANNDDDDDDEGKSNPNEAKGVAQDLPPALLSWQNVSCSYPVKKSSAAKGVAQDLPPALLSWQNVSCSYPVKKSSAATTSNDANDDDDVIQEVQTLHNAHGVLRSTELVAIMGGSGGGKSTLLDILSGRKSLGNIQGEFSILGENTTNTGGGMTAAGDTLRNVSAYVPQQEQFFPTQTPQEAVAFFANLRLGRDERGDHVRQQRIDGLLSMIGLSEEVRRRPIGGTLAGGITIRGLSGGERKRLALACAVAMKPKILFLDEITSGLDSENAVIVISLLKQMCVSLKVAAAVVIHQPSIDVFEQFDRMILLSKGRCIFSNRLSKLPEYYEQILKDNMPERHVIPNDLLRRAANWDHQEMSSRIGMNTSSSRIDNDSNVGRNSFVHKLHALEYGNIESATTTTKTKKENKIRGDAHDEHHDDEGPTTVTSRHGGFLIQTSPFPTSASSAIASTSKRKKEGTSNNGSAGATPPSTYWKFSTIFYRNLQNHYIRNLTNLAARLLIYGSTAALLGLIFWQVADTDGDATMSLTQSRYVLGAGLFLSQTSFLLPFAQISTFFFDKKVFASESALGLYPSWMYSVSQFLLEAWVLILAAFIEATVAIPMMALWNPAMETYESFFILLAFLMINGLAGNAIVLFVSMASFSQDMAFLVGSTYVAIALAASGGYVPFAVMEEWIQWLQWFSPVKYSLQMFGMALFDGTENTIVELLELNEPATITGNMGAMLAVFGICAIGTIVVLSYQKEVR
eukprot:CAMPEP_0119571830 /NCGR_PEP_ID=MMETSP1352-20130426/44316_1 /TAXON_ID=265584 /ORGANISM="Stauroneis constricta, Strain CCMP1120" /LENGTH=899 /DNA_ID=CAMNT_0007621513 /DNA_START=76 /DNA_END=2775 /DNA_ORIENTATION=-